MNVPYKLVSLWEASGLANNDKPLFADTETCGFYGRVRLLQLMQEGWDEVLLIEWPEIMQTAAFLSYYNTVWHNAHYDITTVQQLTETRWIPKRFECSFLLARLAYPEKEKFDLESTLEYVLKYDPYAKQGLNKKALQKSNWAAHVLSADQYLYAATDVYYMPNLWLQIAPYRDNNNYLLDMSTLKSCLDFQWNGMPVIKNKLWSLYESNDARVLQLAVPVNVNSWQQVRPYIGEDESDDLALARFALAGNTRAKDVREARKLIKQNSFLDKFDTTNGRIYGKFKPSARSGRLTSNDQNLQQLPRATKGAFGYEPGVGRVLIYSDYAQLELRTICAIVACKLMEELFRNGEDLHGYTANMVFGASWDKLHRQISKTYNFNLLYGGGVAMIITILLKQVGILQDEATTYRAKNKWKNLWREIAAWQDKGIADWKKGRLGSTPMGRKYKAKMMTDQLNIENQGAGAEVSKFALHYIKPELDLVEDVFLANFIHDSFIIDCTDDPAVYKPVAEMVARKMQLAWFEMSKLFKVKDLPMPVEVKVGYNWGDIENDDVPNIWDFELEPYAMLEAANADV